MRAALEAEREEVKKLTEKEKEREEQNKLLSKKAEELQQDKGEKKT